MSAYPLTPDVLLRCRERSKRAMNGLKRCNKNRTFIGTIERGFDFLGSYFSPAGLAQTEQILPDLTPISSPVYMSFEPTVIRGQEREARRGTAFHPDK
jgi:hypothetical protein